MKGSPPPEDKVVTLENWQSGPWNRWSYQHVCEIIPCARVSRGQERATHLARDPADVGNVRFEGLDGPMSVARLLEATYTDGFLVLRDGLVVTEQYSNGMEAHTRHLLQSISKSITGALAGALVGRGSLDPGAPVTAVVPELQGTSFEGASVRHILDMTAGTKFSEEYDDPDSDIRHYEGAAGWRSPSAGDALDLFGYIRTLQNHRAHGGTFEYRSILTDLLGWIVERASGCRFAEALSELIWAQLGAEWDAEVSVDRRGNPMADGGISVTLRDLARFGQLYLDRGKVGGRRVLPASWVDDTRYADDECRAAFLASEKAARYPKGHYRNQWWVPDPGRGVLLGAGFYGQFLYVDMTARVVIAKLSTLPYALDLDVSAEHGRAFAAIAAELAV